MAEEVEQKKEFLKRDDIRTMRKDIAKLREGEAEQERLRISALKDAEIEKKKPPIPQETLEPEKVLRPEEAIKPEEGIKPQETIKLIDEVKPGEGIAKLREKIFSKQKEEEFFKPREIIKPVEEFVATKEKVLEIKEEASIGLIPKQKKAPSFFIKFLIRAAIVIALLLVGGFTYWYVEIKDSTKPAVIPSGEEEEEPPVGEEEEEPPIGEEEEEEIIIPLSLIKVSLTETLEVSTSSEIFQSFSLAFGKDFEENNFVRILIKDTKENKFLGLEEFLKAFDASVPDTLSEKLNNDATLFIYPQKEGNKFGFIAEIEKNEGLKELLTLWEKTIEKDTEKLFSVLGKEGPALVPYFKTGKFQDNTFRFLTISKSDFGICYAFLGDYLVFTTSFKGMEAAITAIENKKFETIGQLFIIGFDGTVLTPATETLIKKYKPGGALLLSKNIQSKEQLKKLIEDIQNVSLKETGLPLLIAVDQEGDPMSRINFLEEKTPQSKIIDAEMGYQVGLKKGKELKDLGINLNLAPLLEIMEESDFYLNRSFQTSAEEIGEIAKSLVLGQKEAGILTAIKHFPGYIGIPFNPEEQLAVIKNTPEISQFKKAAEAGPELIMSANAVYEDIDPLLPFSFSPKAIEFLKNNLGSEALIISDDLSQNALLNKFSLKEIVSKPIQAGVELLVFSGWQSLADEAFNAFYQAYKDGEIPQEKIEAAVSRIINLKQNLSYAR